MFYINLFKKYNLNIYKEEISKIIKKDIKNYKKYYINKIVDSKYYYYKLKYYIKWIGVYNLI